MATTVAQLNYDNFNIGGEVQEGLPTPYDFELYVENNQIKTKGYNILKNSKVTVENGAMKFIGGIDSYLSLDPQILNGANDFEIEIKFKPTAKPTADSTGSGIFHVGTPLANGRRENEMGIGMYWSYNLLFANMWNLKYGSTICTDFSYEHTYPLSSVGEINISDEFITLKVVRKNNFLASFINGDFKRGYRALGAIQTEVIIVGCENDVMSSSSLINLDASQAFIGYIEYIKIKNYKTNTTGTPIDYANFSIQKNGDIKIDTLKEGYHAFADSKSLYYLPDALQTVTESNKLSALGDISVFPTIENGAMSGNIKATDIIDLTRAASKSATKMNKENHSSYIWNWYLHGDAYSVPNWSTGYNQSTANAKVGYHGKWVKEGPNGNLCMKMIDMNTNSGNPHRWLGFSRPINTLLTYAIGDKLTLHFKAKALKKDSNIRVCFFRTQLSDGTQAFGPNTRDVKLTEDWKEYSVSFTVDSNWDTSKICSAYFYGQYNSFETITWITDVVITKNLDWNMTSEQLYNLKEVGIKFNLNKDIGLDWSKPWTICYWKKPLGERSSYNIDSLGSNAAKDAGRGYIYLGANNTENDLVIRISASRSVHPIEDRTNNYYNNWIFISLKYDGTKFYGSIRGEKFGEIKHSALPENTPVTSNYFDSTHGYDLILGGYDNRNNPASIYKDLLIAKNVALSDADLDYIYRTKTSYKNGLFTSHTNFKETL